MEHVGFEGPINEGFQGSRVKKTLTCFPIRLFFSRFAPARLIASVTKKKGQIYFSSPFGRKPKTKGLTFYLN